MAAIAFQGEDPINYVAHWFSKNTYSKAYQFVVNPVRGRAFWPTSKEGPLLPPLVKRMPGRPAKKRKREPLENKSKSETKLSRKGRAFKCSCCHVEGHNKSTCPKKFNIFVAPNNHQVTAVPTTCSASITSKEKNHQGTVVAEQTTKENNMANSTRQEKETSVATKRKRNQSVTSYSSVKVLRGANSGGLIIGRENLQSSLFVTAADLNARRTTRVAAKRKQNEEVSQHMTAALEIPEFSTQQSTTTMQ